MSANRILLGLSKLRLVAVADRDVFSSIQDGSSAGYLGGRQMPGEQDVSSFRGEPVVSLEASGRRGPVSLRFPLVPR